MWQGTPYWLIAAGARDSRIANAWDRSSEGTVVFDGGSKSSVMAQGHKAKSDSKVEMHCLKLVNRSVSVANFLNRLYLQSRSLHLYTEDHS